MTINTPNYIFKTVPLKSIDLDDRLTCFSFGAPPDSLQKSIEEVGIIHPITLIPVGERFRIVCGHHRTKVSSSLMVNKIPARILDSTINDESLLMMNLSENHRAIVITVILKKDSYFLNYQKLMFLQTVLSKSICL